jgi:hypothetical protein
MEAAGKRYIWHSSRQNVFRIWNLSDIHWMAKGCAESDVKRDIKTIANDPNSFWLGGGDYCDFIGYRDKRFDPDAVAEWVPLKKLGELGKYGREQIRDLFKPIRHKCLGLLIGNHERKYEVATEQESWHHWLCEELQVPYLGYCCLFDVVFIRTAHKGEPTLRMECPPRGNSTASRFRVFAHHGAGYATTPGGKLNKLIQFMQSFEADLYFCGHVHDHVARKEPTLGVDEEARKIVQRERLGIVAGSYLKTYNQGSISYGEQKGYRPTSLGPAVAVVNPEAREFHAEI